MSDYIIKASAGNGMVRAVACNTREIVEYAKNAHNTSPVVSAALGRMLSAACMMGSMMKNKDDLITLKIEGSGPMKGILATADSDGNVKGYPFVNDVILPPNKDSKLDVAGAIGVGLLTVVSDIGLKEPYVGTVELVSGEIAQDLTYYYASSEQIPSSVALGVLLNKDNTINSSGGFIIQLMPYCPEEIIEKLEEKIKNMDSLTNLLSGGKSIEDILKMLLGDFDLIINERLDISFKCDCCKKRVEGVLMSLGEKELNNMINDDKPVELVCHFCNKKYIFSPNELKILYDKAKS